jgi:hypothetical protein
MFSKAITNSSAFLKMPDSSQKLYFHLGMNADDDGFVEHFTVMRMVAAAPDDLAILAAKGFVHVFDDHVLLILDWRVNNHIQKDRYTQSRHLDRYREQVLELEVSRSGTQPVLFPNAVLDVSITDTQVRSGEVRVGQARENAGPAFEAFWDLYPNKVDKKKARDKWVLLSAADREAALADLPRRAAEHDSWLRGFIPMPTTYLNGRRWEDAITPLRQAGSAAGAPEAIRL